MHLLVLSAFRLPERDRQEKFHLLSQCTFWCSVLSDFVKRVRVYARIQGLNAPFGAQCFPTERQG